MVQERMNGAVVVTLANDTWPSTMGFPWTYVDLWVAFRDPFCWSCVLYDLLETTRP